MNIGNTISKRAIFVLVIFAAAWLFLCFVLFNLQINSYEEYQNIVINQITKETTVNSTRGDIYDANMNLLAGNKTVWLIFISPQDIIDAMNDNYTVFTMTDDEDEPNAYGIGLLADVHRTSDYYVYTAADGTTSSYTMDKLIAKGLSEILGVDYARVLELTGKKNRYYEVVKKNVEKEDADRVRAFIDEYGLEEQIYLSASSKRYYPNDTLACHVIGFVNSDGDGVYGVESYYNDVLKGSSGRYLTARDGNGNDLPTDFEKYSEEQDGLSVVTTIDRYLQYELEGVLYETMTENKAANRVAGIAMDVKTGAILAMATLGGYDLNDPYTLTEYYQSQLDALELDPDGDEYKNKLTELRFTMWNNKADGALRARIDVQDGHDVDRARAWSREAVGYVPLLGQRHDRRIFKADLVRKDDGTRNARFRGRAPAVVQPRVRRDRPADRPREFLQIFSAVRVRKTLRNRSAGRGCDVLPRLQGFHERVARSVCVRSDVQGHADTAYNGDRGGGERGLSRDAARHEGDHRCGRQRDRYV